MPSAAPSSYAVSATAEATPAWSFRTLEDHVGGHGEGQARAEADDEQGEAHVRCVFTALRERK